MSEEQTISTTEIMEMLKGLTSKMENLEQINNKNVEAVAEVQGVKTSTEIQAQAVADNQSKLIEQNKLKSAVLFNSGFKSMIEANKNLLPEATQHIELSHTDVKDNEILSANLKKVDIIEHFYNDVKNLNSLSDTQKAKVNNFMAGKDTEEKIKIMETSELYDVFDSSLNLLKQEAQMKYANNLNNGIIDTDKPDVEYLMELSTLANAKGDKIAKTEFADKYGF